MTTALVYPLRLSIFDSTSLPPRYRPTVPAFDAFHQWVRVAVEQEPVPETQRVVQEIQSATGWSERKVAKAIGTSHPTVAKILRGGPVNLQLRENAFNVREVVHRVHILCGRDPVATSRILESGGEAPSPWTHLTLGEFAPAYLKAVDIIRGRTAGMMRVSRPREIGTATAALYNEDE